MFETSAAAAGAIYAPSGTTRKPFVGALQIVMHTREVVYRLCSWGGGEEPLDVEKVGIGGQTGCKIKRGVCVNWRFVSER